MEMKHTAHSVSPVVYLVPRELESQTPGEYLHRNGTEKTSRSHLEMILLQDFHKVDWLRVKRVNERERKKRERERERDGDNLRNSRLK